MVVTLIFRRSRKGARSIEKVFELISQELADNERVRFKKIYLPLSNADPVSVVVNIFYLLVVRLTHKSDIWHITGEVNYASVVLGTNSVLTIHDTESLFGGNRLLNIYRKLLFLAVPAIAPVSLVCISNHTRKSLLSSDMFQSRNLHVIHNPLWFLENTSATSRDSKQVLFIGTKANKNLIRCIHALKDLDFSLCIVGNLSNDQTKLLLDFKIRYENYVDIDDEKLNNLYWSSAILLFPSLYEGFGLPIIEAQARGLAVITSSIPPMNEIASETNAILVDPLNVEEIRTALLRTVEENNNSKSRLEAAILNSRGYTPSVIAKKYISLYQKLMS